MEKNFYDALEEYVNEHSGDKSLLSYWIKARRSFEQFEMKPSALREAYYLHNTQELYLSEEEKKEIEDWISLQIGNPTSINYWKEAIKNGFTVKKPYMTIIKYAKNLPKQPQYEQVLEVPSSRENPSQAIYQHELEIKSMQFLKNLVKMAEILKKEEVSPYEVINRIKIHDNQLYAMLESFLTDELILPN